MRITVIATDEQGAAQGADLPNVDGILKAAKAAGLDPMKWIEYALMLELERERYEKELEGHENNKEND